jgi:hypothetical protein
MNRTISDINDEMKAAADYAIKEAKGRFGQDLDYSDDSIVIFENLLVQAYQSLSRLPNDEHLSKAITRTAYIWGSFLGEYMCQKLGGKWKLNGSDRLVYISNILFSPIHFIYQKITSHPEYKVEIYLNETKKIIYEAIIRPQQLQYLSENIGQPKKNISNKQLKLPVKIDKHILFTLAGIGGILLVIVASIIGYRSIKTGGRSAFGLIGSATSSSTINHLEKTLVTATPYATTTQSPTVTMLPTYTPNPTITPHPSETPSPTNTKTATSTPTETQKPITPTRTHTKVPSSTSIPYNPTNPPIPPTELPPPTATEPAPVGIESCEIDPSTVPAGYNVPITFIVHFSAPGYGFEAVILPPNDLGQSGCSGTDDDGDGIAYCDGKSGELTVGTTVNVTFKSSVGNCPASYSSP